MLVEKLRLTMARKALNYKELYLAMQHILINQITLLRNNLTFATDLIFKINNENHCKPQLVNFSHLGNRLLINYFCQ